MSPILVTATSRSVSNFERSNIGLKVNKLDGVDSNCNSLNYGVRKKVFGTLFSGVGENGLQLTFIDSSEFAFCSSSSNICFDATATCFSLRNILGTKEK